MNKQRAGDGSGTRYNRNHGITYSGNGVTRTAFTTVTVHTRDYSDIDGVYDLDALE